MTAIQARLNGFRDNKGGSVITWKTIEENNSVSIPDRVTTHSLNTLPPKYVRERICFYVLANQRRGAILVIV